MRARLEPLSLEPRASEGSPCRILVSHDIKPCIERVSKHRIEILVPSHMIPTAERILEARGYRIVFPQRPREAGLRKVLALIGEERFYEAHIASEELMAEDNRLGRILALYTALLVKKAEGLERAVGYLLSLLEFIQGVGEVLDMDCVREIVSLEELVEGRQALACVRVRGSESV